MIQKEQVTLLLSLLTVCCLIVTIINGVNTVTVITNPPLELKKRDKDIKLKAFEKVNKALVATRVVDTFSFDGSFKPPFKALSAKGIARRSVGRATEPIVKQLFLKGTLNKVNALAILEDDEGKTYICKEGDRVHNRLVVKVSEDRVTLKDAKGTTVLEVKE